MDVSSFCFLLFVHVLFMLHVQEVEASCSFFLRTEPNKLQFFEYDGVTFHCESSKGSTGLKILNQIKGEIPSCKTTTTDKSTVLSCNVKNLYLTDGGEYWCESGEGERSNSINITVTAGSVVLESPALITEGKTASLHCRNKTTPSNPSAEFYRNGVFIGESSSGTMSIPSVSARDRGLYKCKISEGGESAESWLAVQGTCPQQKDQTSDLLFVVFRNILPVVLMIPLLLTLGLIHGSKQR